MPSTKDLVLALNEINAIKFGEFKIKSGAISPIYITLRTLISHPRVMRQVAEAYVELLQTLSFDRMAAVPYTALPIVAAISSVNEKPWIYTRKEAKEYGIKVPMEGEYNAGETIVVVDDLVTDGASKFDVIQPFQKEGLKVQDVVVLLDREQGASERLAAQGFALHSVFTMSDILSVLKEAGVVDDQTIAAVKEFLTAHRA